MDSSGSNAANKASFSENSCSYWARPNPNSGNDSMKEPRPRMMSARPSDMASIGETALLDDVADHLRLMDRGAGGVDGDVAESVEPELHVRNVHGCSCRGECGDGNGAETRAKRSREPVPWPVGRTESDDPEHS